MKKFIDANLLKVHVRQTTEYLRQVAQFSSALWQDLRILELIGIRTCFLQWHYTYALTQPLFRNAHILIKGCVPMYVGELADYEVQLD
jgi:hypothetical protein